MMAKTHITVGIAASLAICMPTTPDEVLSAVMGGAIGGILCDIECRSTPQMRDALYGRFIVAAITSLILLSDKIFNTGIIASILSQDRFSLILGSAILLVTCIFGRLSDHRTFTHSLLFVLLISFGFYCVTPKLLYPVLAGGLSHLVIDTLNRMPVPWLYPLKKKGICFKLCYASKTGNAICMWIGFVTSLALLAWRISIMTGAIQYFKP